MDNSPISLVEDGLPRAVIVLAPNLGRTAVDAARDMVRVIALMSGAALPLLEDGQAAQTIPQVHIGPTAFAQKAVPVPSDLPVNGYRIATRSENGAGRLVINGVHSIGISHGIYHLLSNELGVLWGMAHPIFEDIPKRDTVRIAPVDRTERPAFGFRVWSGNDPDWIRRNRIDEADSALPFYGHGHNLFNILPPSKYANHPEYYAMIDGERRVPERDGHTPIQPCLTNPEVIRIAVETVRRFFDENPDVTTYSLCPNDSDKFCECPSCRALDDRTPRYRGRRMNSESYFHFVNAVAGELLKSHPNRYVSSYAYWTTELPPETIHHLPPNVVVYLTQDSSQYFDSNYEQRDREILRMWSAKAYHLVVYDYYGLGWFTPRYYPSIVARTLPFLKSMGVKGFYCESYPYWAHIGPQLFLASRLLWDPFLDAKQVLDEWFERMFREAAVKMRLFYGALERYWITPRQGKWFEGLDNIGIQLKNWKPEFREEAWRHIEEARKAARSTKTRQRVEYVRAGFRLAYLMPRAHEHLKSLSPGSENLEKRLREVGAIVSEVMAVFRTAIEVDPTYGSAYYRGDRAIREFTKWKAYLGSMMLKLLEGKPELRERLASEDGTIAELLHLGATDDPHLRQRIERMCVDLGG